MPIVRRSEVLKMATLSGEAAKEFTEKIRLRNQLIAEESLRQKKIEALHTKKEVFDYEKLRQLVDPDYYADASTPERRLERLEYKYYVDNADLKTLQEFADHIIEVYRWKE
jgi:hypothetical protein